MILWFDRPKEEIVPSATVLAFNPDEVDHILIANPTGNLGFTRNGDNWQFDGGIPARNAKIAGLLAELQDKKSLQWAGESDDDQAKAQVQLPLVDGAHRLTLSQGSKTLLDLIIGRSLPAQNGQIFLRREDQRKFYLGNYNLDLTRPLGDWLDVLGELHNFEAVQISLGEGDDKIILSREQENPPAWKVTNITSKQNLRLDAPLPKLPALLGKLEAIDMQPVSQLKPDSTERHQIIFTGKNGLDLFVTLAPVGGIPWAHFALSGGAGMQDMMTRFNKKYSVYAFLLTEENRQLLMLRLSDVIETRPAPKK